MGMIINFSLNKAKASRSGVGVRLKTIKKTVKRIVPSLQLYY